MRLLLPGQGLHCLVEQICYQELKLRLKLCLKFLSQHCYQLLHQILYSSYQQKDHFLPRQVHDLSNHVLSLYLFQQILNNPQQTESYFPLAYHQLLKNLLPSRAFSLSVVIKSMQYYTVLHIGKVTDMNRSPFISSTYCCWGNQY